MILIRLSIIPIRSLGDVYLSMTNPMSSPFVVAISVLKRLLQRFCSVDFIGTRLETLILIVHLVSVVREAKEYL
jgi:hypothetical protein